MTPCTSIISAARRATTVISANRFSTLRLSKVRTSTSFSRSSIICSWVGGGFSLGADEEDEDDAGDGGAGTGGAGMTKAPGMIGDGEQRSMTGGARAGQGARGGGEGDNSHRGAGGRAGRKVTEGGRVSQSDKTVWLELDGLGHCYIVPMLRGGGRPGSSSVDEGDLVANTKGPAAGGEGQEVVEAFHCLAGEGGRKEQTPDVHNAHCVPRLWSHSSPLEASSYLSGWAARRAKRLAKVLTVPERGTGEEVGALTRTRFWTDIGDEVRRCLFFGDRRIEVFFFKLASCEGVFLLAGVEDGPATASGAAEDDEDANKEVRAAKREER
ncbi:hypothetical protein TREMEDRAFT_66411 [Tremella mesenterica DSM 1558]|uniref:uncharacterized protein n=1 Tax=Tremella mesenterica (strain ATCC 24925 / CBS 8224 / DSM 1558 / NBRC 9311 / NRRL Y-6157 / RJB 2259-6 / UBC 559-6) TaxID=578456 RepID=UPI00032B9628|nr:uncharacterized protein TREMEDRAFT_66411 [Tremella mesenterica DSM 1558]EIW65581.1 hypothetical protein TREMEDRAFT_66411 [Tremella mesenterica DSM 1558]